MDYIDIKFEIKKNHKHYYLKLLIIKDDFVAQSNVYDRDIAMRLKVSLSTYRSILIGLNGIFAENENEIVFENIEDANEAIKTLMFMYKIMDR